MIPKGWKESYRNESYRKNEVSELDKAYAEDILKQFKPKEEHVVSN